MRVTHKITKAHSQKVFKYGLFARRLTLYFTPIKEKRKENTGVPGKMTKQTQIPHNPNPDNK